eukprot:5286532-Pyramimonas_sp.AAC.1
MSYRSDDIAPSRDHVMEYSPRLSENPTEPSRHHTPGAHPPVAALTALTALTALSTPVAHLPHPVHCHHAGPLTTVALRGGRRIWRCGGPWNHA